MLEVYYQKNLLEIFFKEVIFQKRFELVEEMSFVKNRNILNKGNSKCDIFQEYFWGVGRIIMSYEIEYEKMILER